jgi:3'-5' exoribonuclease
LASIFDDKKFVDEFKKAPAAMYMHHACTGGLVEHTWGILKLCEVEAEIHPSLDEDLLITGAILHDIGKIHEFQVTTNIKITEKGMLLGHVGLALEMVTEKIAKIHDFPEILKNKVLHMIISHHGEKEYGTMIEPAFPEAAAVYLADNYDAKITQYIRTKKDVNTEDFRTYSKTLGSLYLK